MVKLILYGLLVLIGIFLLYRIYRKDRKVLSQWKKGIYFAIILSIMPFIVNSIIKICNDLKEPPFPDITANILTYDLLEDSIFFKFEIENIGTGKALNVWHISVLDDNTYMDNFETIKEFSPREKRTLFSFIRFIGLHKTNFNEIQVKKFGTNDFTNLILSRWPVRYAVKATSKTEI